MDFEQLPTTLFIIQEAIKGVAIFASLGIIYSVLSILFGG
jgi:hypothetical protein